MTVAPIAGLSVTDSARYVAALTDGCAVYHRVSQLTLSHDLVCEVSTQFLDGQINIVDGGGDGVTRTLQAGFSDPDHTLRLDSDSPSAGVGGLDRLIQVQTAVRAFGWSSWLTAPSFLGRPSSVARDGDSVTIEVQDKACLHLKGVSPYTIPKRTNTVEAIRSILVRNGETRFRFPSGTTYRMTFGVHIGGPDEDRQPWKVAVRLARSIGYQLYYDTLGFACLRLVPQADAWDLVEHGPTANTLTRVKLTTDLTRVRNRVVVTGRGHPPRRGHSSQVLTAVAVAPTAHPLSAESLATNGVAWHNTAFFDEPDIHTQADADKFATARLNELLDEQTSVETTAMPAWHLEAKDRISLKTAKGDAVRFRLLDASFPLGPNESGMTIGYTQTVRSPAAGRLRGAA